MVPANAEKQRRAARRVASDVIARLHHLDDATLCALVREVWAEVEEREKRAARERAATMTGDRTGAR